MILRTLILLICILVQVSAVAKDTKVKAPIKPKKVAERYDPVPGGGRADYHFQKEWNASNL
jgi:hypothetical protein